MKHKFFTCDRCGNMMAMIRDAGTPVQCCGEKMHRLVSNSTEASGEKHKPVYTRAGDTVHVSVGSAAHPMTEAHYIEWICLEAERVIQYAHLKPEDEPEAVFALCKGDNVRGVYAFCNQHDLWKQ